MEYRYRMRLRPFDMGCQPTDGLEDIEDEQTVNGRHYWNILIYSRELSDKEVADYELDKLN